MSERGEWETRMRYAFVTTVNGVTLFECSEDGVLVSDRRHHDRVHDEEELRADVAAAQEEAHRRLMVARCRADGCYEPLDALNNCPLHGWQGPQTSSDSFARLTALLNRWESLHGSAEAPEAPEPLEVTSADRKGSWEVSPSPTPERPAETATVSHSAEVCHYCVLKWARTAIRGGATQVHVLSFDSPTRRKVCWRCGRERGEYWELAATVGDVEATLAEAEELVAEIGRVAATHECQIPLCGCGGHHEWDEVVAIARRMRSTAG